jgi:hypothetical protein
MKGSSNNKILEDNNQPEETLQKEIIKIIVKILINLVVLNLQIRHNNYILRKVKIILIIQTIKKIS